MIFPAFKQVIHFLSNRINIESLRLYVINFNRLSGLQFNPSFFFKIFQSNNNSLTICIIIVQDSLNINNSPYFLCKAMFDDSCDKMFSFPLKTVYNICRLQIVFKGIFIAFSMTSLNSSLLRVESSRAAEILWSNRKSSCMI